MKHSLYEQYSQRMKNKKIRILTTVLLGLIIQACSKHKISSDMNSYSEMATQNQQVSQTRTPTSDSKEIGQQNS